MWSKSEDNVYETKILQLASGSKKNYILELEIPPTSRKLLDIEKSVTLVQAICTFETIDGKKSIELKAKLDVIALNPDEEVKDQEEDKEVIEHYYRVKSAEVMNKARKLSD